MVNAKEDIAKFKDYSVEGGSAAPKQKTEAAPAKKEEAHEDKRGCPMKMERPSSEPE